jgi:hypothetical protein
MNARATATGTAPASTLAPLLIAAVVAAFAIGAVAPVRAQARSAAVCSGVVQGAAWSYKGQRGSTYTVLGVNGVSCVTGIKFMPRWTHERGSFDLKPVPPGWHCSAIGAHGELAKVGQCTTAKGGIFEWLPRQKR